MFFEKGQRFFVEHVYPCGLVCLQAGNARQKSDAKKYQTISETQNHDPLLTVKANKKEEK
jgi:hypothetical protein